jgi:PEP-CTERM motif
LDLLLRELELPVQGLVRRSKSGKEYNNRKIVVYPENRFPLIFTCGYVEAAGNFILLEVLMSRLPFILSLLITGAVLSTPPSVRASLISYDITATINGGSFDGQGFQAFFTYDTRGHTSDQDSPAGVVAPGAVAFTDEDAEINVAKLSGGGSTLQVEASNTYDNLSSYSLAPVVGTFVFTANYPGMVTLNQPLPGPDGTGGVFTVVFTSGPLSVPGVGFTSINLAQSVSAVPEPSSLLLLVSGSLMVLGVCWWRQRQERVTPATA